jgi:hypothetical protein
MLALHFKIVIEIMARFDDKNKVFFLGYAIKR